MLRSLGRGARPRHVRLRLLRCRLTRDGRRNARTLVLSSTADDATFRVRIPSLQSQYKLLNVGRLSGPHGHYAVDFDLVAGNGPILTVDQAEGSRVGVARSYTNGARALGNEHIALGVWRVYDSPAAGGVVYVTRCRDGVEIVLSGGTDRDPPRSLARSLGPLF